MVKKDDLKTKAFVTTFLSIFGFIIALIAWKKDKYVMYYAKQSLVVFIFAVAAAIVKGIVGWIPIIGWGIAIALTVIALIFWLLSWINALSMKMEPVPIIGKYGNKIKL